jgi:ATP-dependent Lon protease
LTSHEGTLTRRRVKIYYIVPEKLHDVEEIAIFPLATVLFPGALLPLHIFEDRYKQMIQYSVDNGGVFGLAYRSDAAIGRETPPDTGSVGCVAKINAVVPLGDGKMNIVSTGLIRYRVLGLRQSTPFVVAKIETVTDDLEPGDDLNRIFDEIVEVCRKFLEAAQALDEPNAPVNQELPEEPEAFSLLVASALPIDNDAKQTLLEMTSTRLRLTRLKPYVTSALSQYSDRLRIQKTAKSNGHGRLKTEP